MTESSWRGMATPNTPWMPRDARKCPDSEFALPLAGGSQGQVMAVGAPRRAGQIRYAGWYDDVYVRTRRAGVSNPATTERTVPSYTTRECRGGTRSQGF